MTTAANNDPIRLAVLTGGHPYDVPAFTQMLRNLPGEGVDAYLQDVSDFAANVNGSADTYDVVMLYTMYRFAPADDLPWYHRNVLEALEQLGESTRGIFVLHHSLYAFPDWPVFDELVGLTNRVDNGVDMDQQVHTHVAADHPVTKGLSGWTMTDETYNLPAASPDDGNMILLTTEHPKCMATLCWTRHFGKAPVICYQSGHDGRVYANANFQRVIANGTAYLAGQ